MFKNFSKTSILLALTFLALSCQTLITAQEKEKIVSGEYESLTLGVNPDGELTGYFYEATGVEDNGNPRFTCAFFIYGAKAAADGSYKVKTWFPEFPEDVIEGEIKALEKGVNLRLEGEHGGCWNVAPVLKEKEGLDFSLTSKGDWASIRMILPKRVWLFRSIDAGAPQKIFVDKNDAVKVFQTKDGWAEVRYISPTVRRAYGWMKISDFYALEPKVSINEK